MIGTNIVRRAVERFPDEMCEALFEAILHHDQIDEDATLPASIRIDYCSDILARAFRLSDQLWRAGVEGDHLRRIARTIVYERALGPTDLEAFRHIRARFKHLRFAFALFGENHLYDRRLDRMTIVMGRLQDMLRHGLGPRFGRNAARLRFWTSRIGLMVVVRSMRRFRPTSGIGFQAYIEAEMKALQHGMAEQPMSMKSFHSLRKIISRQVALYDTLKIVDPSTFHVQLSRYLGSLNGMMGAMHDDLVAAKSLAGEKYRSDPVVLPAMISDRLRAFIDSHAVAGWGQTLPTRIGETSAKPGK